MFPIFTPLPGVWRGLGFFNGELTRLSFWIYCSTILKGKNALSRLRKMLFFSFKKKLERRKKKYSNCELWLLGVCWGRVGSKFFWRVWWRVSQLKSVICLKKGKIIIKGKSFLRKPLRGSADKKKRRYGSYMLLFFFCINDCMNFQIHEDRILIQKILG